MRNALTIAGLLPFLLPIPSLVGRAPFSNNGQPMGIAGKQVDSFQVEGASMIDAALQLGQQAEVPIGIEYVDLAALDNRLNVNLARTTVAHALDAILSGIKGYTWRTDGHVLIVSHEGAPSGKRNLLDHLLREFVIPRACTLAQANHLLQMALKLELDPRIRGFVGNYSPGDMEKAIGPPDSTTCRCERFSTA